MKYGLSLDDNNYLLGFCHYDDERDLVEIPNEVKITNHITCWKYVNGQFIFDEEKAEAEDRAFEEEAIKMKEKEEHLDIIASAITTKREPSDKLGYDWIIYYLGTTEFKRVYVESEDHKGTEDDPFIFELGMTLTPNAFYKYEEHLYVYMGDVKVADKVPTEDDSFARWDIE